ncbi:MAG: hypothetical protein WBP79_16360 [Candidatus Acidiferrales bacterium]
MKLRRKRAPISGWMIVIGGQCRKVGKTALVVELIRAVPKARWIAVKITPYTESGCPVNGRGCSCGPKEHTFAIRVESKRSGSSDTSRFLNAGAKKAIWVQTKEGRVADALPLLAAALKEAGNVIVESNAIVKFWRPDVYLLVMDPRKTDFKASARAGRRIADGFVFRSPPPASRTRRGYSNSKNGKPIFFQPLGLPLPSNLQSFVRQPSRDL